MEKKSIVLLAAIAASAIGATGLAFSIGVASKGLIAGVNEPKVHTVSFKAGDVAPGAYDSENWLTPFTLHKDDAIEDADGTTYDIESVPYNDGEGTFIYNDGEGITFGGDHIITIASANSEAIYVRFALVKKAELNLSASFISYYIDVVDEGHYHNSDHFTVVDESDPVYTTYEVSMDTYSNYGDLFMVDEVKLVFSCPK